MDRAVSLDGIARYLCIFGRKSHSTQGIFIEKVAMDTLNSQLRTPRPQGLYHPRNEHDACGIGFVANIRGERSHGIIRKGLEVLINLTHRGATGCDPDTGDGAGMIAIDVTFLLVIIAVLRLRFERETSSSKVWRQGSPHALWTDYPGSQTASTMTRSSQPTWASIRCGQLSSTLSVVLANGSLRVVWGRWASVCPRP